MLRYAVILVLSGAMWGSDSSLLRSRCNDCRFDDLNAYPVSKRMLVLSAKTPPVRRIRKLLTLSVAMEVLFLFKGLDEVGLEKLFQMD